MHSSLPQFFSALTADALAAWAGEAVFQRGRAYHKAGKVRNLALAPDGGLLATVDGTRKYATLLFQEKDGKLASLCTCPYGPRCKHAVAIACASLALPDGAASIPLADAGDKRLLNLEIAVTPDEAAQTGCGFSPQDLEALLNTYSKERLIALVMQAASLAPDLRIKQQDWDSVLCMRTEDFVRRASLDQFKECRQSAEKLGVWSVLRPLLMDFLIEKKIPWTRDAWPCRNRGKAATSGEKKHPDCTTLIAIAIDEKNPAEVLKWYDLQRKTERGYGYNADRVAEAVRDHAPERAIALWKGLAEAQIALVKPSAYVEAANFLRKVGKLMRECDMTAQWDAYIQSLRNDHRRKPRLMEVLDGLSSTGERIAGQGGQGKK